MDVNQTAWLKRLGNLPNPILTFWPVDFFSCGLNKMKLSHNLSWLSPWIFTHLISLINWLRTHFIACPCPGKNPHTVMIWLGHLSSKCKFPKQKYFYITVNCRCSWFDVYHSFFSVELHELFLIKNIKKINVHMSFTLTLYTLFRLVIEH